MEEIKKILRTPVVVIIFGTIVTTFINRFLLGINYQEMDISVAAATIHEILYMLWGAWFYDAVRKA